MARQLFEVVQRFTTEGDRQAARRIRGVGEAAGDAGKKVSSLKGLLVGAFAGVSATVAVREILRIGKASLEAAAVQEAAERRVQAQITATGNALGLSLQAHLDLAAGIQRATGIGDEALLGQQAILLSFKRIGREVFGDVIEIAQDMAEVLRVDSREALIQVAKAMEDPVRGMTALRRSGTQFTAQQEAQVKALVESGRALDAQKMILAELTAQYGGAARAMRETREGQLRALTSEIGDLQEEIGQLINALTGGGSLVEGLIAVVSTAKEVVHWIGESEQVVGLLKDAVFAVAPPLWIFLDAMGQLGDAFAEVRRARQGAEELARQGLELLRRENFLREDQATATSDQAEATANLKRQVQDYVQRLKEENEALERKKLIEEELEKARLKRLEALNKWHAGLLALKEAEDAFAAAVKVTVEALERELSTLEKLLKITGEGQLSPLPSPEGPSATVRPPPDVEEFEADLIGAAERFTEIMRGALNAESFAEAMRAVADDFSAQMFELARQLRSNNNTGGAAIAAGLGIAGMFDLGQTGNAIMGGASQGAQIGTMIMPGIGTLWGAVIGALVGWAADAMETTEQAFGRLLQEGDRIGMRVESGSERMRELIGQALEGIASMANAIVEGVGGTITEFAADMALMVRENGTIVAWINGVAQEFETVEEAMQALVIGVIRASEIEGVGPVVAAALESWTYDTIDGLERALQAAQLLEGLDADEFVAPVHDAIDEIFAAIRLAFEEGFGAEAVTFAAPGIASNLADAYDRLMGVQENAADQAEAHFHALEAEVAMRRAQLLSLRAELQARAATIEAAHRQNTATATGAKIIVDASAAAAAAQGALGQATAGAGAVVIEVSGAFAEATAAINQALATLDALVFDEAALEQARRAATQATRGAARAEREREAEARRSAETEMAIREARAAGNEELAEELERRARNAEWIERMAEALGEEGRRRAEAVVAADAIREAEEALSEARREAIATARELAASLSSQDLGDQLREMSQQVDDALADVQQAIDDYIADAFPDGIGAGQAASAFATQVEIARQALEEGASIEEALAGVSPAIRETVRALLELEEANREALERIGREALDAFGSPQRAIAASAAAAAADIQALLDNMEALGISASEVAQSVREGVLPDLLAMAEAQARAAGDEKRAAEIAERRRELDRELALLQLAVWEQQLILAGAMDEELAELIEGIRGDLQSVPPVADELGAAAQRIADAVREIDQGIGSLSNSMISFIQRWGGAEGATREQIIANLRRQFRLERLEMELNLANLRARILLLQAEGAQIDHLLEALGELDDMMEDIRELEPDFEALADEAMGLGDATRNAARGVRELGQTWIEVMQPFFDEAQSILDWIASQQQQLAGQLGPVAALNQEFDAFVDMLDNLDQTVISVLHSMGHTVDGLLEQVEALRQARLDQLFATANQSLIEFAERLTSGDLSGRTTTDQARAALAQLQTMIQAAMGDDDAALTARQQLAGQAQSLLSLASGVLGMGGMQELRNQILTAIGTITGTDFGLPGGGGGIFAPPPGQPPIIGGSPIRTPRQPNFGDLGIQLGQPINALGELTALTADRRDGLLLRIANGVDDTADGVESLDVHLNRSPRQAAPAGLAGATRRWRGAAGFGSLQ